ncbi:MAG: sodium:proton antiporter [SAR324 cluster bacterium]|nr:sodium:proton antiporter [SAR324 cluster bacterium]
MELGAFQTITIALVLGVLSYILSRWLKIPAVLFYLISGLTFGKIGLGLINTDTLGAGLLILVEITVAIILFEGGLSLTTNSFRSERSGIRRILAITIPLTGIGGAVLARYILHLPWQFAIFFGALIVVTGPTVIGSILKSVYLPRRLEILLNWESIWGDVIGVLASAVALELVDLNLQESIMEVGIVFLVRIIGGVVLGLLSGFILIKLLTWISALHDSTLYGIVIVAGAIGTFFTANVLLHSSGPLTVAVSGFVLSNAKKQFLHDVRHFKEQVSSLFIGMMFVMLSAFVDPIPLISYWPEMLAFALILGLFIRPLSVLLALIRTPVLMSERLFIGLIGPRGIIAVATAGYATLIIEGHPQEMALVLNLTFAIIFFSGLMSTALCRPLAKVLKILVPESRSGMLIVGVNSLSSAIASFASKYINVSFLETNRTICRIAQEQGLETICTDILDEDIYEDAVSEGFGRLLAITRNDSVNELIASKAALHLDPKNVYWVPAKTEDEAVNMVYTSPINIAFSKEFCSTDAATKLENHEAFLKVLKPEQINGNVQGIVPLFEIVKKTQGLRIITDNDVIKNDALCFVPVDAAERLLHSDSL